MAKLQKNQRKDPKMSNLRIPKDKIAHASISFILVLVIAPFIGIIFAPLVVISLGIAKEVIDYYGSGHADPLDFVADIIGVLFAIIIGSQVGIG